MENLEAELNLRYPVGRANLQKEGDGRERKRQDCRQRGRVFGVGAETTDGGGQDEVC